MIAFVKYRFSSRGHRFGASDGWRGKEESSVASTAGPTADHGGNGAAEF